MKQPEDALVSEGSNAFFNCSSPLLHGLYIVWCINSLCYVPSQLPYEYSIKPNGLLIPRVYAEMNETTFQCLIQYKYLLKTYFSSDVGVLTVSPSGKSY